MTDRQSKHYFLGANTADGFYSLYDNLVSLDKGDFLWVIKGGPGCGKSSFMRIIGAAAERSGLAVDYVACSGDPDSLDGIVIPEIKTAYMDATSPHSRDANLAGVNSGYIDLSRFYDLDQIAEFKDELKEVNLKNGLHYNKAYALLKAAGVLKRGWLNSFMRPDDVAGALRRLDGIIKRELGTRHRSGGVIKKRFLTVITCKGRYAFPASAQALCKNCYVFESRLGLDQLMLEKIAQSASSSGFEVILCPDPLTPEIPEAVFIPAASLGFVASGSPLGDSLNARRVHLDPKGDKAPQRENRSELQRCEKSISALMNEAVLALNKAKSAHDKLEELYNPFVDFDGVYALAREHIKRLGLS
jgi:hypothetical protein